MSPAPRPRGFEGDLAALSVVEIVQTLNLGGKTAHVVLRSSSGSGAMWFVDGALTHAAAGSLFGELALWTMVEWTTGRFAVEYGLTSESRSIAGDTTQLLLDALRRLDERSSEAVPDADRVEVPPVLEADVRRGRSRRLVLRGAAVALLAGAIVVALLHDVRSASTTGALAAAAPGPESSPPRAPSRETLSTRPLPPARSRSRGKSAAAPAPAVVAPESPLAEEPVPNMLVEAPEAASRAPSDLPAKPPLSSQLRISGESRAGGGTLSVLVDGAPVFTHENSDKSEPFSAEVALAPGEHEIVARLEGGAQAGSHEDSTRAVFASGEARLLRITANRVFGSPVKLKLARPARGTGAGSAAL